MNTLTPNKLVLGYVKDKTALVITLKLLSKYIFYIPLTYNSGSPFRSAYDTKWYKSKIHLKQCKLRACLV